MALPDFYKPDRVGTRYIPAVATAIDAGNAANISPSHTDKFRVALLLIDMQADFIHPDGALSVPGAVEDTRRTIEWMYHNVGSITTIIASLDSHIPLQIFSPAWWIHSSGDHPAPFTVITADQVHSGGYKPLYEPEWSKNYVQQLETRAKKQLMIWPYHTLIGTPGHTLTPALYEAIAYHTAARRAQPMLVTKGTLPNTENYSIFEPEVKRPDLPNGGLNVDLLNTLAGYDRIYIAGQAKSHCVLESVTSLMRYFENQPDVIAKLRLISDMTSSVAHPEIDFDSLANQAYEEFAAKGLTLTTSAAGIC